MSGVSLKTLQRGGRANTKDGYVPETHEQWEAFINTARQANNCEELRALEDAYRAWSAKYR